MSGLQHLALSTAARTFAERLLLRHPDWEPFITQYTRVHAGDTTAPGSLWMEVPSSGDPAAPLWAFVQEEEVLVGLGHRAAEALFPWEPTEQDEAIDGALNFIDDVATAEVVGAWERHRLLWLTWERVSSGEQPTSFKTERWSVFPPGRQLPVSVAPPLPNERCN